MRNSLTNQRRAIRHSLRILVSPCNQVNAPASPKFHPLTFSRLHSLIRCRDFNGTENKSPAGTIYNACSFRPAHAIAALRRQHLSRIQLLVDGILPALSGIDSRRSAQAQLERAVAANVRWSRQQLLATPEGKRALRERRAKLVGANFELHTGLVRFLPKRLTKK
jgi:hypothetical protein